MAMSKGEETRHTILVRALSEASKTGLDGLSIGGLAKEVGMSKSGLFAHFRSKEDLQLQVLRTAVDRFVAEVVAPALRQPRGIPRLRALFHNWLEWSEDLPGGCPFIAAAAELDDRPGPVRDYLASSQKDWLDALATAARIAIEEGHLDSGVDPRQFAYEMNGVMLAHHHSHRLLRDPASVERAKSAFAQMLDAAAPASPTS